MNQAINPTNVALLGLLLSAWRRIEDLEHMRRPRLRAGYVAPDVLHRIVDDVAVRHGTNRCDLLSPARTAMLVSARGEVIDALDALGYSAAAIGRALNRDHTSVLHWMKRRGEEARAA